MRKKFNHTLIFHVLWILLLSIFSCNQKKTKGDDIPVAKVEDKILYLQDMQHIFNKTQSTGDSAVIAKSYIDNWIKTQLLLKKAELNLTEDQLNIADQLEAYRSSLLIYKYEEQMVRDKVDTTVTKEEVEKYYADNNSNFVLSENLVKALFIKIPISAPENESLKRWYKSDQPIDVKNMEKYCYSNASKYSYFDEDWISFAYIQKQLPKSLDNEDEFLKSNKIIETQDNEFLYLVKLNDIKAKGSIAPVEYVKSKIKDILLNKRKLAFIGELEKNIYNDAADHSNFKIYNLDKK
jgi:hypothetical protein